MTCKQFSTGIQHLAFGFARMEVRKWHSEDLSPKWVSTVSETWLWHTFRAKGVPECCQVTPNWVTLGMSDGPPTT